MVLSPSAVPNRRAAPGGGGLARRIAAARSAIVADAAFYGFAALIALAPLWYGSAVPLAHAGNALVAGGLAAVVAAQALKSPRPRAPDGHWLLAIAGLYLTVLLWIAVQASPLTPAVAQHPVWASLAEVRGTVVAGAMSMSPVKSWAGLTLLATCGVVFWLAYTLCRAGADAKALLTIIGASGTAYSVYALLDVLLGIDHVLLTPKDTYTLANYGHVTRGTFINGNHYAAHAGLSLIVLGGLVCSAGLRAASGATQSLRRMLGMLLTTVASRLALLLAGMAVLLAGLVLSGSRAGIVAALVGMFAIIVLHAIRTRRPLVLAVFGTGFALALVLAIDLFGAMVVRRAASSGEALDARLAVYRLVRDAIAANPWAGFGSGTFADFFPLYRDQTAGYGGLWNAAHNSYLEIAATLGLPAALAFFAALALIAGCCVHGALIRRENATAPIVACAVTLQLALHSLVEFPLQTQAITLAYAAILGAGFAQSWPSGRTRLASRSGELRAPKPVSRRARHPGAAPVREPQGS